MLIVGEVHTGLLRGREPVTGDDARRLVDLVAGEPVVVSERPLAYVRSPDRPVGVDCPLVEARQLRGIGTVLQRSAITGGHVVQGSAYATVVRADRAVRQPWSHYLANPGRVEVLGRAKWAELAEAFAAPAFATSSLDLGAIAGRAADSVQRAAPSSGRVRLRSARTRLRWVARLDANEPDAPGQAVGFVLRRDDLRLLRVSTSDATPVALAAACEDIALHDWLLTTLIELVRKAAIGILPRAEALDRLVPAIDYLLHLWMPGARGGELADWLWAELERRGGFSRQWETLVHRIRDQLSVGAVAALTAAIPR